MERTNRPTPEQSIQNYHLTRPSAFWKEERPDCTRVVEHAMELFSRASIQSKRLNDRAGAGLPDGQAYPGRRDRRETVQLLVPDGGSLGDGLPGLALEGLDGIRENPLAQRDVLLD